MADINHNMKQLDLEDVQDNFEQIFDDVFLSGEPVKITRDRSNAVLVSEEIWCGMTETLNLLSIPGMRESVRSGMRDPIVDTTTDLDW